MKGLVSEIHADLQTIIIFYNSQSVIFLMKDQALHEMMKLIDVRYHFVCEVIVRGDISINKISTHYNLI